MLTIDKLYFYSELKDIHPNAPEQHLCDVSTYLLMHTYYRERGGLQVDFVVDKGGRGQDLLCCHQRFVSLCH